MATMRQMDAEDMKMLEQVAAKKMKLGASNLADRTEQIVAVDVKRVPGKRIEVPEEITLADAVKVLQRTMQYEESIVSVNEEVDCFPLDGCLALKRAVEEFFGVALSGESTQQGMFGPFKMNAQEYSIAVGPGKFVTAPWGAYPLLVSDRIGDDIDVVQPSTKRDHEGRVKFVVQAVVRRKYQPMVMALATRVRQLVRDESIYRGQAIRIKFIDRDGDLIPVPEPVFMDTTKTDASRIVFSRDVEQIVSTNVLGPIVAREACRQAGIPFKRGVILAGPFGVGKTLLAEAIAQAATAHGITFVYLEDVREFEHGWHLAQQYAPAVIFGEDIDRAFDGDYRTVEIDRILNTIDGVDSKQAEIMTVLTTNEIEEINRAMLRPGRIDVVVDVQPPDAEAAARLVRVYLRDMLDPVADMTAVGEALAGQIPAIIREACERSKLSTIARTRRRPMAGDISADDLLVAAATMRQQAALLAEPVTDLRSDFEKAADRLGEHLRKAGAEAREAAAAGQGWQHPNGHVGHSTATPVYGPQLPAGHVPAPAPAIVD